MTPDFSEMTYQQLREFVQTCEDSVLIADACAAYDQRNEQAIRALEKSNGEVA